MKPFWSQIHKIDVHFITNHTQKYFIIEDFRNIVINNYMVDNNVKLLNESLYLI